MSFYSINVANDIRDRIFLMADEKGCLAPTGGLKRVPGTNWSSVSESASPAASVPVSMLDAPSAPPASLFSQLSFSSSLFLELPPQPKTLKINIKKKNTATVIINSHFCLLQYFHQLFKNQSIFTAYAHNEFWDQALNSVNQKE